LIKRHGNAEIEQDKHRILFENLDDKLIVGCEFSAISRK
jgi:hypothetical protein